MISRNAINLCWAVLLLTLSVSPAWAEPAAVVSHLAGTLSVKRADGSVLIAAQNSEVEAGDTLATEKDSFARLRFSDGGEVVLRPNSVFKLDQYLFKENMPEQDNFVVRLLKGGLRTVTGLISKRGNRDAYRMQAYTATIGIRGTVYSVRVCEGNCPEGMKDGVYTKVLEGLIVVRNPFGEIECSAAQSCFSPPDQPPFVLPEAPPIDFEPPAQLDLLIEGETVLDAEGHRECKIAR